MLDGTYAGLQASVAEFLNRTDIASAIPDYIRLAETQLNRRLRCSDMVATTNLTVTGVSTALPVDFNGALSFELPAGNNPLRYIGPDGIRALKALYPSSGTPAVWTVMGSNVEVVPAPSGSFTCPLVYYQRIPPLTVSNTTNWLLTKHPDAYLYGALLQAAPYLKDDERVSVWGSLYEAAISDINANDGRVSFGHGMTPPFRGAAPPAGTASQSGGGGASMLPPPSQ